MNPLEILWDIIKDYIEKHYPDIYRSYKHLRSAVQEAWESITHAILIDLIRGMADRWIDVILANGGYTKY